MKTFRWIQMLSVSLGLLVHGCVSQNGPKSSSETDRGKKASVPAPVPRSSVCPVPGPAPGSFVVNTTADDVDLNPGDGCCATACDDCTLRAAIQESNALADPNTIQVPSGIFIATFETAPGFPQPFPPIEDSVTIKGQGVTITTIDGNGGPTGGRVFNVVAGDFVLQDLTVFNGSASTLGSGGGLLVGTGVSATLERVQVFRNRAVISGGGIFNRGTLNLIDSTVNENSAERGGGIVNSETGIAVITGSTVNNNQGSVAGGLINFGRLTLTNDTVSGNQTRISTSPSGGGGFNNHGRADLNNVTMTLNKSTRPDIPGGILNIMSVPPSSVGLELLFKNTILAGNINTAGGPTDCGGPEPFTSQGYNLIQDPSGCTVGGDLTGNVTGMDPLLGALSNNGGPTQTHPITTDSPAFNAGSPIPTGDVSSCAPVDQRGVPRPQLGRCDIGSFELQ